MNYKIQIDDIIRDATPEEAARIEQIVADNKKVAEESARLAAAASSARAKLAALGLTEAELSALLGV